MKLAYKILIGGVVVIIAGSVFMEMKFEIVGDTLMVLGVFACILCGPIQDWL